MLNKRKKMCSNIAKSLTFAICEYEHRHDRPPTKIFAELDAYYALQASIPMLLQEREIRIAGIPVEAIQKMGLGMYLCGDPVTIREFHDPGVQLIFPEEVHK